MQVLAGGAFFRSLFFHTVTAQCYVSPTVGQLRQGRLTVAIPIHRRGDDMAMTVAGAWAIARAWAEGVPFDYGLAAGLAGVEESHVRELARRKGWVLARPGRGDKARLAAFRDCLWQRAERIFAVPAGEPVDKTELDQFQLLMKIVERLEPGEGSETAAVSGNRRAAMAAALDLIDRRIATLAEGLAKQAGAPDED